MHPKKRKKILFHTSSHWLGLSWRVKVIIGVQVLLAVLVVYKLWHLQIYSDTYAIARERGTRVTIPPGTAVRGSIFVRDGSLVPDRTLDGGRLFPLASNERAYTLVHDAKIDVTPQQKNELAELLGVESSALNQERAVQGKYVALRRDLSESEVKKWGKLPKGLRLEPSLRRTYPDERFGGQVLGFVGFNNEGRRSGQYGLEGYYEKYLEPAGGIVEIEGSLVGDDLVLTMDRTIQYHVCRTIAEGVKEYNATSGSAILMRPETGEIVAMCSVPDFVPERYREFPVSQFRNPNVSGAFEPGSTFKTFTMAAGIDKGLITPESTYFDKGEEKIDRFTIRNSDRKAHGIQTMTEALQKSLNMATIHVVRLLQPEQFRHYVEAFGFGAVTGIDISGEAAGNIRSLSRQGEVFQATASFGQGLTATPLQVINAYAAIANGGKLMQPYVVAERRRADGTIVATSPKIIRRVISESTARTVTGMLAAVIHGGHGHKAEIPGYIFAGKTGTAQVADVRGGYAEGKTIQTFVGYGPLPQPKFVLLVSFENPQRKFAEGSAVPTWRNITSWLINYWQIPKSDTIMSPPLPPKSDELPINRDDGTPFVPDALRF